MRGGFGRRMTSGREEDFALSHLDRRAARLVWDLVRPHLSTLLLALTAMLVVTLMSLAGPYLAKVAIDDHILTGNLHGLAWVSFAMLLSYAIFWFSSYWQAYLSSWVAQRFIGDLRTRLYNHMQDMSIEFFHRRRTGDLVSRITNDLEAVSELVTSGFVHLLNDVFTLVGIAVVLVLLDTRLALVSFLVLPPIAIVMHQLGRRMRRAYAAVRERLADLNVDVEESIAGMRVVQALNREEAKSGSFSRLSLDNLRANLQAASLFALLFPTMTLSRVVGEALVLWYGGLSVIAGTMTLGVVMAFLSYVRRFFAPLAEISQIYNTLQSAGASLNRTMEILSESPEVKEPEQPLTPPGGFCGGLQFQDVSFAYEEEPVLQDIDLQISPGENFALVGQTGAGKTTMVNLLTRFYDPDSGQILLDGVDLRHVSTADLRQVMAVVPQNVFLFDTTIRENIRFADPHADDEQVEAAAARVRADQFIREMPEGFDTTVGEGGSRLSGGQRQLIALSRAALLDAQILILDEATSHVDPHSEMLIRRAMPEILRGRTAFMIAHRLSTLERADHIGIMEDGRLLDVGTHEELIHSSALYRDLVKRQSSA